MQLFSVGGCMHNQGMQVTQSAPVLAEKLLLHAPVSATFRVLPRMLWALDTRTVSAAPPSGSCPDAGGGFERWQFPRLVRVAVSVIGSST